MPPENEKEPGGDRHDPQGADDERQHVKPPVVQAERAYIDHQQRRRYQRELFAIFFTPTSGSDVDKIANAHRLLHEAPLVLRRTLVNYLTAIQRVHLGSWRPAPSSAPTPDRTEPS